MILLSMPAFSHRKSLQWVVTHRALVDLILYIMKNRLSYASNAIYKKVDGQKLTGRDDKIQLSNL